MILFDQGGGGGGAFCFLSPPADKPSFRGPLVFPYFFRSSNFEYPARIKKKRKNWREIHPLDPLPGVPLDGLAMGTIDVVATYAQSL
jgi:hypothetical protein